MIKRQKWIIKVTYGEVVEVFGYFSTEKAADRFLSTLVSKCLSSELTYNVESFEIMT